MNLPQVAGHADLDRLDGQRVVVVGLYRPTWVRRRPPPVDEGAETVAIDIGDVSLMLEVYYEAAGKRPPEERARFAGRIVRVVGTLHRHTPTQMTASLQPAATMIGPYLGSIESI